LIDACSRSFGRRPATRYQEELKNGPALIFPRSRQVLPGDETQPFDDGARPDPYEGALPSFDFGYPFHPRPQLWAEFGESSLDTERIPPLLGDSDGGDLAENHPQRRPGGACKRNSTALSHRNIADVTFVNVDDQAIRIERGKFE